MRAGGNQLLRLWRQSMVAVSGAWCKHSTTNEHIAIAPPGASTGSAAATPGLLHVCTHIQGVRPHDSAVLRGTKAGPGAAIAATACIPQAGRELRADGLQQVQSASVYMPTPGNLVVSNYSSRGPQCTACCVPNVAPPKADMLCTQRGPTWCMVKHMAG
jgi:hypothetical protein